MTLQERISYIQHAIEEVKKGRNTLLVVSDEAWDEVSNTFACYQGEDWIWGGTMMVYLPNKRWLRIVNADNGAKGGFDEDVVVPVGTASNWTSGSFKAWMDRPISLPG